MVFLILIPNFFKVRLLGLSKGVSRHRLKSYELELGGSRMERKSIWKNFLLLTIGGLLALHVDVSQADVNNDNALVNPDSTDECVLEE